MPDRMMFVVNPASSNGKTRRRWPEIKNILDTRGFDYDFRWTGGPWEAAEITRDSLKEGFSVVVAVGGDGTLNEVVNGFFLVDEETRNRGSLGVISMGTGSDFIRTVGIPRDIPGAVTRLAKGNRSLLDVGLARFSRADGSRGERYFLNVADVGMGGETALRVNSTSKALGGFLSFLWGVIVSISLYKNKEMTLVIDGEVTWQGRYVSVAMGNGRFFGGGMKITPQAMPADGLLDVTILPDFSKPMLFWSLPKVYSGRHLDIEGVKYTRGSKIALTSPEVVLLETDGEMPGQLPVEVEVLPRALQVIL
jgi:diacylglycerol kinase (ATP)